MTTRNPPPSAADDPRPFCEQLETQAIHGGVGPDPTTGAVVPPVYQSTTYAQHSVGDEPDFTYSRAHNPTVTALETALATLEDMPHAFAFSTGMSAITTLMLTLLGADAHVVCSDVAYGGTVRLLDQVLTHFDVDFTFADASDPQHVARAIRPETRLVIIETPANPTMKLADIAVIAELTRERGILLAVDNTFLTAVLQRPADLGADIIIYSTTKYIEGHNTTVGGALLLNDDELAERIDFVRKTTGTIQSPWNAWLTAKGLKTLPLRIRQHSVHALEVAQWLEQHPLVERVAYPLLDSFPQVDLARRQQLGGGGMLAFELFGGFEAGKRFMEKLQRCILAENLGAVETLVTHPASMTHSHMAPERRRRLGITDGLVRLSVGLEHPSDLIADLDHALNDLAARRAG